MQKLKMPFVLIFVGLFVFQSATLYAAQVNPKYFPADIHSHWAFVPLNDLVDADVLNGYDDYSIDPDGLITRAEFAQLLVNAAGSAALEGMNRQNKNFVDVAPDKWYYNPVQLLASSGYIDGIEQNRFAPNRTIQRDEMAKMVHNVFRVTDGGSPSIPKNFSDVPGSYWAKPYIDGLTKAGLIDGYPNGEFKPLAFTTRAEAAAIIYNALHKQGEAPADDALNRVALDYESESLSILQSNDFRRKDDMNNKNCTGYFKALNDWSFDKLQSMSAQGITLKAAYKTAPQATVVAKSALYATVQLKEVVELTYQENGRGLQTKTLDAGALLLLKKMPQDQSWKIYDHKSLMFPDMKLGSE